MFFKAILIMVNTDRNCMPVAFPPCSTRPTLWNLPQSMSEFPISMVKCTMHNIIRFWWPWGRKANGYEMETCWGLKWWWCLDHEAVLIGGDTRITPSPLTNSIAMFLFVDWKTNTTHLFSHMQTHPPKKTKIKISVLHFNKHEKATSASNYITYYIYQQI